MNTVHAKFCFSLALAALVGCFSLTAPSTASANNVVGTYGDWTVFKTAEDNAAVCFVGTEPKKATGNYDKRGETYVLVTHRPAFKEIGVVSIRAGYQYKQNDDVIVTIDSNKHMLYAVEGHAWAKDSASDKALVRAMQRGSRMTVVGHSWRGTKTTDTYSLNGFTKAYNTSLAACGIK